LVRCAPTLRRLGQAKLGQREAVPREPGTLSGWRIWPRFDG
jgi:hypothetical protein